jgi:hypothetical protein
VSSWRGRGNHSAVMSSWALQESQVESCEHQDNSYIHCQPFPEPVSEEQEINGNYNSYQQHNAEYDRCLFSHFRSSAQSISPSAISVGQVVPHSMPLKIWRTLSRCNRCTQIDEDRKID